MGNDKKNTEKEDLQLKLEISDTNSELVEKLDKIIEKELEKE
jgi:hypothetical protein